VGTSEKVTIHHPLRAGQVICHNNEQIWVCPNLTTDVERLKQCLTYLQQARLDWAVFDEQAQCLQQVREGDDDGNKRTDLQQHNEVLSDALLKEALQVSEKELET